MNDKLTWYLSRAGGITAWALAAAAVLWGLALTTRVLGRRPSAPWLLDLHRFLGGLSVVFVGVHLFAIWADGYVHFGVADLFVPMASNWRPGAVAWGVVAFWLLVAVEVTSLGMRRIPRRTWRYVHLGSYLVFVSGTVHFLQAGTDGDHLALSGTAVVVSFLVAAATVYRVTVDRPARRRVPAVREAAS